MDKKRKGDKPPRDFWEDIFGESFNEFIGMRRDMERIFQNALRSSMSEDLKKKPFIYGFSVRVGPDGIPNIQQFGNTKFRKSMAKGDANDIEREPLTDIMETDDQVAITIELPGVEKEDINMQMNI